MQTPDTTKAASSAVCGLEQHPLSAAFPRMDEADFDTLRDSVMELGILNSITLYEGAVLDGWHRYTVAQEFGYVCPAVELACDVDARNFVIAQNKARRHVTKAQLAMAVTAVYAWKPMGANQHEGLREGTECPPSKNTAELAKIAGVSERTIKQAKAVQARAEAVVVEAVKDGAIGLPKAEAIAKLPREQQAIAISDPVTKPAKAFALPTAAVPSPKAHSTHGETPPGKHEEQLERLAEMAVDLEAVMAENRAMQEVFDADDRLAAAHQLIKAARREITAQKSRLDGLLGEKNELIRKVKSLERTLEGLMK